MINIYKADLAQTSAELKNQIWFGLGAGGTRAIAACKNSLTHSWSGCAAVDLDKNPLARMAALNDFYRVT